MQTGINKKCYNVVNTENVQTTVIINNLIRLYNKGLNNNVQQKDRGFKAKSLFLCDVSQINVTMCSNAVKIKYLMKESILSKYFLFYK